MATPAGTQYYTLGIGHTPVNPRIDRDIDIRTALATAYLNADNQAPHGPAPTWQALTEYKGGMVVRGAAIGSTTNLYLCLGSTTGSGFTSHGTSAAAGGPTGTDAALITDGTVKWQYIGKATSTGSTPLYSTVTPTTSADVMDGYIAFVNQNNFAAMGLTATTVSTTNPQAKFTNGVLATTITYTPKNQGTAASPTRSSSGIFGCVRMVTNCRKWIAFCSVNAIYQYDNKLHGIKVNGKWLSESHVEYTAAILNPGAYLLDLSSFGSGEKVVELYFVDDPINIINKVAVGTEEYVYPLEATDDFKVSLEGDSISDNTYIAAIGVMQKTEVLLGEYLGSKNVQNNAIGGTGFVSNSGGTKTTYIDRLSDITTFAPDLLIIGGSHNDDTYTSAQRLAAYAAYFAAVRAALPGCTVGVVGANQLRGETSSGTQLTVEQDLKSAFNTWADPNSFFVPVLTATPVLLPATANDGYFFQGGGAAPYNNTHPTGWYNRHMMQVIANATRKFFGAQ